MPLGYIFVSIMNEGMCVLLSTFKLMLQMCNLNGNDVCVRHKRIACAFTISLDFHTIFPPVNIMLGSLPRLNYRLNVLWHIFRQYSPPFTRLSSSNIFFLLFSFAYFALCIPIHHYVMH